MTKKTPRRREKSAAVDELRKSDVMAHLLDALDQGQDIGHYGRLVFAMVGRHFLDEDELTGWLAKDRDCSEEEARSLVQQVTSRDYNPPRRERLLEWQAQQDFPIVPNPDDPDSGNLYRDLTFPEGVYEDISEYHEQKAEATA
jgi:hypothetical protein